MYWLKIMVYLKMMMPWVYKMFDWFAGVGFCCSSGLCLFSFLPLCPPPIFSFYIISLSHSTSLFFSLSLSLYLIKFPRPYTTLLGQMPDTDVYVDMKVYPNVSLPYVWCSFVLMPKMSAVNLNLAIYIVYITCILYYQEMYACIELWIYDLVTSDFF